MALHTKKAFAEMCGLTTGNLSNYANRHPAKVIYSGDYIDDSIQLNALFLAMRKAKIGGGKKETLTTSKDEVKAPETNPKVSNPTSQRPKPPNVVRPVTTESILEDLMVEKTNSQIEKMTLEMEKIRLQNSKFMGEIVPIRLIRPLIVQHNLSILTESKNFWDNVKRIFAKRHDLTPDESAEMESEYTKELNIMIKKAADLTSKSVKKIIEEFAEKKSVGERE